MWANILLTVLQRFYNVFLLLFFICMVFSDIVYTIYEMGVKGVCIGAVLIISGLGRLVHFELNVNQGLNVIS